MLTIIATYLIIGLILGELVYVLDKRRGGIATRRMLFNLYFLWPVVWTIGLWKYFRQ